MKQKALIAMSGGVDSSVAALLCQDAGYDCTGVTMRLFSNEDAGLTNTSSECVQTSSRNSLESGCCSLADVAGAREVAATLGMPFYVFDLSEDFRRQVIERFVRAYEQGETPNPCIDCNRFLKFGRLLARAAALDFDLLSTGHYARVFFDTPSGRWQLARARDHDKDQSYVLYTLTQRQLACLRLPLGDMLKSEVRALAASRGLATADKPDSQDICFVPGGDYAAFIKHWSGRHYPAGDFLDWHGKVIGQHRGLIHYTPGQRKGLGSFGRPLYVRAIDSATNTVTLGEDASLYGRSFTAREPNWIAIAELKEPLSCRAKIGYRHLPQPARIEPGPASGVSVRFDEPQRAITPGQAVVFYDDDLVLGGATIDSAG
jgi:tRNA-specific 2-thiouridylase